MNSQLVSVSEHEIESEGLVPKSNTSIASRESCPKYLDNPKLKLPSDIPCIDPSENEHYLHFLVCDFDLNKIDSYVKDAASLYDGQDFEREYADFRNSESKTKFSEFYVRFIKDLSEKGITFPEVGKVDSSSYFIHGLIVAEKETYSNNKRSIECIAKLFYSTFLEENRHNSVEFAALNTQYITSLWAMKNSADIQDLRAELKRDINELRDDFNERINKLDDKFTHLFEEFDKRIANLSSQLESYIKELRSRVSNIEETQLEIGNILLGNDDEITNSPNMMKELPDRKAQ